MKPTKKKPVKGVFLSNFGTRRLTLQRNIDRIIEIQKYDPSFNYLDDHRLQFDIDAMIKTLEEMKLVGIK